MTIARAHRPVIGVLAVAVLIIAGCAVRVDVFDAATAPAASDVGYRLEIRRIARSWGRLELDLNLDPGRTMVKLAPVFPQVTSISLMQVDAVAHSATIRADRSRVEPAPRTHTPTQIARLSDGALAFRVTFDAAGVDGATDPIVQVTGVLYGQPLIWRVVVPPHQPSTTQLQ